MKRRMNVLSIDFDYFQKVDLETLSCYPDGHDLGTELSKVIWAGHYANPKESKKILAVEVDQGKLDYVERVIQDTYSPDTRVLICNSHRHIYELINDEYEYGSYDGVDIYNIDMHHDLYNNSPNVDCGNWISHILDEIDGSTVTWIQNPISSEVFGIETDRFKKVTTDLSEIDYMSFDVIFVCRSDIWTPPHLDSYFTDFSYNILELYEDALVERGILEFRDCSDLILQTKKMQSEFLKDFNNKTEG